MKRKIEILMQKRIGKFRISTIVTVLAWVVIIALFALTSKQSALPLWKVVNQTATNDVTTPTQVTKENEKAHTYFVQRVVDGDTIQVQIGKKSKTVRLIGIDAPESVHPDKERNVPFGKVASKYTKKQLLHKKVTLTFDVQETDKYGRLLAYVWKGEDLFNLTLIKKGYAKAMPFPPNIKYVDVLDSAEQKAKAQQIGFWKNGLRATFP